MLRLFMLLLLTLGIVAPCAAADYEINLSALDALGGANGAEPQLPLPVVKPQPVKAKKITARPQPAVRVKKSVEPVVKRQPEKVIRSEPKPDARKTKISENEDQKNQENVISEVQKEISAQSDAAISLVPAQETVLPDVSEKKAEGKAEQIKTVPEQQIEIKIAEPEKKEEVHPVVPAEEKAAGESYFSDNSAILVFDGDSAELTSEIVNALTAFASSLDVQNPGKITIEAYNYDSGEGSFARKRLSLSRAVAVRSWLLGKGYKSFGIKIINTEDAALQNNILVSY